MSVKIPIDEAGWAARTPPVAFLAEAGFYRFIVPGRSEAPRVKTVDGQLVLQTDRSASHRALAALLGAP